MKKILTIAMILMLGILVISVKGSAVRIKVSNVNRDRIDNAAEIYRRSFEYAERIGDHNSISVETLNSLFFCKSPMVRDRAIICVADELIEELNYSVPDSDFVLRSIYKDFGETPEKWHYLCIFVNNNSIDNEEYSCYVRYLENKKEKYEYVMQ